MSDQSDQSDQPHRGSDEHDDDAPQHRPGDEGGGTSTGAKPKQVPAKQPKKPLPQWRVILHNDDVNYAEDVVESIVMLTPLKERDAELKTKLAHEGGSAQLLVTHRERAELYVQQFASRKLTVTAEPEQ